MPRRGLNYLLFSLVVVSAILMILFWRRSPKQPVDRLAQEQKAAVLFTSAKEAQTSRDFKTAVARYQEAISFNPNEPVYFESLGVAQYNIKDYRGAIASFEQALKLTPGSAFLWNGLANAARDSGDRQRAFESYRKAIELDPGFLVGYTNLAYLYRDQGAVDRAKEVIAEGLAKNPDSVELKDILKNL